MIKIEGLGPEISENIYNFFNTDENIANINSCLENGVKIIENEISKDGPLKNKKISITGSFEDLSRNQLINLIEKNSGKFVSTISKNIDFIIVGKNPGNKEIKAKKLKINCLDINSFREIIEIKINLINPIIAKVFETILDECLKKNNIEKYEQINETNMLKTNLGEIDRVRVLLTNISINKVNRMHLI